MEELKQLQEQLDRIEQYASINAKNVLDLKETHVLTGYSVSTLYRLCQQKKIPYYKREGRVFFKRDEVEQWQTEHKIKTCTEIQAEASNHLHRKERRLI